MPIAQLQAKPKPDRERTAAQRRHAPENVLEGQKPPARSDLTTCENPLQLSHFKDQSVVSLPQGPGIVKNKVHLLANNVRNSTICVEIEIEPYQL